MSQPSIRVTNRLSTSRSVISAIETHGPVVAAAIAAVAPKLGGAQCLALFAALAATLKDATDELQAAELTYGAEQADDDAPRTRRDAATDHGASIAGKGRDALVGAFGDAAAARYGLAGTIPHDPPQLLAVLKTSDGLLQAYPAKARTDFGHEIDTEAIRLVLAAAAQELSNALDGVTTEARELQVTLVDRDRKLAAWQTVYVGVAGAVEGLFRLAGEGRLADYLRPTVRKVSGEDVAEAVVPSPA